jgi:formylglycine-generating enzyme required for sulfatase activity
MRKRLNLLLCGLLFCGLSAGCSQERDKTFTNSLGQEFVFIPAGTFLMRGGDSVPGGDDSFPNGSAPEDGERPARQVIISKPFYLGKFEVTQEQWQAVLGDDNSDFPGQTNPVENVSWEDVQVFIRKLNEKEGVQGYRLPTDAEWEYAAEAGARTAYFWGDDPADLGQYDWFYKNSQQTTHPVGKKKPNPWGLYDVYGNVMEWVEDWYGDYEASAVTDPTGPASGNSRVIRGGSWLISAEFCRPACRGGHEPGSRRSDLGFRLAFTPGR